MRSDNGKSVKEMRILKESGDVWINLPQLFKLIPYTIDWFDNLRITVMLSNLFAQVLNMTIDSAISHASTAYSSMAAIIELQLLLAEATKAVVNLSSYPEMRLL